MKSPCEFIYILPFIRKTRLYFQLIIQAHQSLPDSETRGHPSIVIICRIKIRTDPEKCHAHRLFILRRTLRISRSHIFTSTLSTILTSILTAIGRSLTTTACKRQTHQHCSKNYYLFSSHSNSFPSCVFISVNFTISIFYALRFAFPFGDLDFR